MASPVRRAPRARTRTRDPEEKRARVLDAARTLFAERGYAATTTADVARRANVSEGILFHHYGSKEGLLEAVAADYGRALGAAMFAGAEEADPDGPPGAEPMLRRAFAFVREQGVLAAAPPPHVGLRRAEDDPAREPRARSWPRSSARSPIRAGAT